MADFRKCIPVLAVVALILGLTSMASAQGPAFNCVASAATPFDVRSEGLTELVGDLVIRCDGGTPTAVGAPIPQVNIAVFIGNTTVTSRLLTGNVSEALLMLDEPGAGTPVNGNPQTVHALEVATGNGVGGFGPGSLPGVPIFNYYGAGMNANIFNGSINPAQPNAVQWAGIPVDPPGTNGTRIIRITNIRINANGLGVGTPTSPPVQVFAFLSVTPSQALPITNNAQQVVGNVRRSLATDQSGSSFQQCLPPGDLGGSVSFTELMPNAFKPRVASMTTGEVTAATYQDIPGALYYSESGFYSAATGAAGLADFGTRLKAVFTNVPLGVSLSVPSVIENAAGTLRAVLVASETGASVFPTGLTGASTDTAVSLSTTGTVRSGMVVYEIVRADPFSNETLDVPVVVDYTPNPSASPGLGSAQVNASYAPTPPAFDATAGRLAQSALYPIPRFVDTSTAADLFTINVCATNLLFPFVTNQVGFDTGLAIANTSEDAPVFDTTPQEGICTLYSYGDNAPAAVESPTIAAGTVWTALASSAMPNFQGYVIARCTFQYAHGFAFVSDLGARNIAMGYLALVIPDRGDIRGPSLTGTDNNQGEQLNQ